MHTDRSGEFFAEVVQRRLMSEHIKSLDTGPYVNVAHDSRWRKKNGLRETKNPMPSTYRGFSYLVVAEEQGAGEWRASVLIWKGKELVWQGELIPLSFPTSSKALHGTAPLAQVLIDRLIASGDLHS